MDLAAEICQVTKFTKHTESDKVKKMRTTERRLQKYHTIYEQLYENPSATQSSIAQNTATARSTVSRCLAEMYEHSILKGPMLFVNPAQNYHEYATFLEFEQPFLTYECFKEFSHVISGTLNCGKWNTTVISEKPINFSRLQGFRTCLLHNVKGATSLSKVEILDWNQSMEKIQDILQPPREKTTLYREISHNPWNKKEWTLFDAFKHNTRVKVLSIVREHNVRYGTVEKWFSHLHQFANVQPAFYPHGLNNYSVSDFLFQSDYQKQLKAILGLLPSTGVFFPVGEYLFSRLFTLSKKEETDLFSLIHQLEEKGYFTKFHFAKALFTF